ncbi:MAG: trypsin-like peptidase domain-containing protein [Planctomycetes bacterium]|nr:trypsin-like peptidase domain-containing protein [Planctomycetota bacterium]
MNKTTRSCVRRSGQLAATLAVLALAILPAVGRAAPPANYEIADLVALETAFVKLAADIRPSVVAIRTYDLQTYDLEELGHGKTFVKMPVSHGSGFIISSDGYIASNRHVLEEADSIQVVTDDGSVYTAQIVQADIRSDLAVIKIDAENLRPVRWADTTALRVNQWAFACGNPFGLANSNGKSSVTVGVISALGRNMTSRLSDGNPIQYYGNLIETSAAVNPGSSGGPLFNLSGEVIGVVTAIETSSGVSEGAGFAIPADHNLRNILEQLKAGREVRYGFLGVTINDVPPPNSRRVADLQPRRGALITDVKPANGPAGLAGLEPDDVVVEFGGIPIENMDHLVRLVGFTPVGTDVVLTYLRRQVRRTTTVRLGDRYELLDFTNPDG